MSEVDLHIHTTASDGRYSPETIVRKSASLGLAVISICDHDTVAGIATALATAKVLSRPKVIPGVEISTDVPHGEVHILGYFIDYTDAGLLTRLDRMRNSRQGRALGMINKLAELGINIDWERVKSIAGDAVIGRPHIAQAMLEKGYISSLKEAFAKYIGRDGPAYVEREKMTPTESVELILKSKGLPVLAHPLTLGEVEPLVIELTKAGLVGMEVYYDGQTSEQTSLLSQIANRYNLIPTGGSDYHGLDDSAETMLGDAHVPKECAEKLIALAKKRNLNLPIN